MYRTRLKAYTLDLIARDLNVIERVDSRLLEKDRRYRLGYQWYFDIVVYDGRNEWIEGNHRPCGSRYSK